MLDKQVQQKCAHEAVATIRTWFSQTYGEAILSHGVSPDHFDYAHQWYGGACRAMRQQERLSDNFRDTKGKEEEWLDTVLRAWRGAGPLGCHLGEGEFARRFTWAPGEVDLRLRR